MGPILEQWQAALQRCWFVFLDGASASGKSTFKTLLLQDPDFHFVYAMRYTTRGPRPDDAAQGDYLFCSTGSFQAMIDSGEMMEYRHYLFGISYGNSRVQMLSAAMQTNQVLGLMNLGNVATVKAVLPHSTCVLIDVPVADIELRLRARGMHAEEQIEERLMNARNVQAIANQYDYVCWNPNGALERAYADLKVYLQRQLRSTF